MKTGWSRKSYVTQCADPTQVVDWTNGSITITEFQGVYVISFPRPKGTGAQQLEGLKAAFQSVGQTLHQVLENDYEREQELEAENYPEMFNDGIYGGR
jgi:hypothetical protein